MGSNRKSGWISWNKITGRKWRCKVTAGCPRGPPGLFPAVCPCEALCAGFPGPVASVSLPAQETAVSRPVSQLCEEDYETLGPLGHRSYGGRKRCGIKEWRLAAPLRSTPARNADWGNENGKDYAFFEPIPKGGSGSTFSGMAPLSAPELAKTPVPEPDAVALAWLLWAYWRFEEVQTCQKKKRASIPASRRKRSAKWRLLCR